MKKSGLVSSITLNQSSAHNKVGHKSPASWAGRAKARPCQRRYGSNTMRFALYILCITAFPVSAEALVKRHIMENEIYLFGLAESCLNHAVKENASAIDESTGLPVQEIDRLYVSMPFMMKTVTVNFDSSQNAVHRVWSFSCTYHRFTDKLKRFSSLNSNSPHGDVWKGYQTEYPKKYKNMSSEQIEEAWVNLVFGFEINYNEFLSRYASAQKSVP